MHGRVDRVEENHLQSLRASFGLGRAKVESDNVAEGTIEALETEVVPHVPRRLDQNDVEERRAESGNREEHHQRLEACEVPKQRNREHHRDGHSQHERIIRLMSEGASRALNKIIESTEKPGEGTRHKHGQTNCGQMERTSVEQQQAHQDLQKRHEPERHFGADDVVEQKEGASQEDRRREDNRKEFGDEPRGSAEEVEMLAEGVSGGREGKGVGRVAEVGQGTNERVG